jgi:sarcosine oxidase
MSTYDVIVVGLGALGAAALDRLSRRGLRVLGVDHFAPPHDRGSSHGELRITRAAIGEGAEYVPLALRSHELWREIERESGEELFVACGLLVLGKRGGAARHHGQSDFVGNTIACAERFGIPHEMLDARVVQRRFPQFETGTDELGYYEPGAGFLRPERCVAAQLELARRRGADLRTSEKVVSLASARAAAGGGSVEVVTDRGRYLGRSVVVAAGPWLPELVPAPIAQRFRVYRQVQHWFRPEVPSAFSRKRFPVFIWIYGDHAGAHLYGFPSDSADGAVKIASEDYASPVLPDSVQRSVDPDEAQATFDRHVRGRLHGLSPRPIRSSVCLYTSTEDGRFVIDAHPEIANVTILSACSGHGFKHSPALGEAVAERIVTGASALDLGPFALSRFG